MREVRLRAEFASADDRRGVEQGDLIGIILPIDIVKKNAIVTIDFVLQLEREQALSSQGDIVRTSFVRLRPGSHWVAIAGAD